MATTTAKQRTSKNPQVNVKVLKGGRMPYKATEGAACYDIFTRGTYDVEPKRQVLVNTGIILEIPEGYHVEVFLRSGVALKTPLRLANSTGIIDSDYKDELKLIVDNIGSGLFVIHDGDRLAQFKLVKNEVFSLTETEEVGESTHGGFGSTGRN